MVVALYLAQNETPFEFHERRLSIYWYAELCYFFDIGVQLLHTTSIFSRNANFMRLLDHLNYIHIVAKTGSIRRAADRLHITSTALNRRILALEEELGCPIFERLPHGVRLNVAGELLIQHIRRNMADLSKVTSQIADLSGMRRGHVTIASNSEIIAGFLPQQIAHYRTSFPDISFDVLRRSPEQALQALQNFEADIAFIFGPVPPQDFHSLASVELEVQIGLHPDHPLASQAQISLIDCQDYPAIMPAEGSGLFDLLQATQAKKGIRLQPIISSESFEFIAHYQFFEDVISFLVPIGDDSRLQDTTRMVVRPLMATDNITGRLHIVQAKGRVLPVAAAKFGDEIIHKLSMLYPDDIS